MSEELKENMCHIVFPCMHTDELPCVYFEESSNGFCKYLLEYGCNSYVARVNSIAIELKKMGIDLIPIGRLDEIKAKLKDAVRTSGLKPVEDVLNILEDM